MYYPRGDALPAGCAVGTFPPAVGISSDDGRCGADVTTLDTPSPAPSPAPTVVVPAFATCALCMPAGVAHVFVFDTMITFCGAPWPPSFACWLLATLILSGVMPWRAAVAGDGGWEGWGGRLVAGRLSSRLSVELLRRCRRWWCESSSALRPPARPDNREG